MNYYKRILLIMFMALFSTNTVEAAKWINTENESRPIVYLDTKSIYRFNDGAVYAIRYFNNKNDEVVAKIYTDLKNKVGIIEVIPYKDFKTYKYSISSEMNMKTINKVSPIYNSLEEVKKIINNKKIKFCSPLKCSYNQVMKTTNNPSANNKNINLNLYQSNKDEKVVLIITMQKSSDFLFINKKETSENRKLMI